MLGGKREDPDFCRAVYEVWWEIREEVQERYVLRNKRGPWQSAPVVEMISPVSTGVTLSRHIHSSADLPKRQKTLTVQQSLTSDADATLPRPSGV